MVFAVLTLGIVFIVMAIVVLKLHPFLALILASVLVGLLSPRPLMDSERERAVNQLRSELEPQVQRGELSPEAMDERLRGAARGVERGRQLPRPILALELTAAGFGATAGGIGIVIVLAAIIGQCLMDSGAADRIVRWTLAFLGEKRAGVSLLSSGYFLSIPVFFDTVFFLLIPLARSLRLRTGRNYVLYVTAICAGAVITHSLAPPTPGPLAMAETLGIDLGLAIAGGVLLGLLPALAGLVYARFIDRKLDLPLREAAGAPPQGEDVVQPGDSDLPGLFVSVLPVLLPVVLISAHSLSRIAARSAGGPDASALVAWTGFLGNKNFALLLATFIAALVLQRQRKLSLIDLGRRLEPAVASAGTIILITSAGGAFGQMLSRIGIDQTLRQVPFGQAGLSYLLLAFCIAAVMKIAQGSGTVAIITTAGIMASVMPEASRLPFHPIYIFAAIGFGSMVFSWMNDSGFWVVCKMSGFTEVETLQTWTALLCVIGITGLSQVVLLSYVFPLL